jgi:hypothetical protein
MGTRSGFLDPPAMSALNVSPIAAALALLAMAGAVPLPTLPRSDKVAPIAPAPAVPPAPSSATSTPSVTAWLRPSRARLLLGTEKEIAVELAITGADARGFEPVRALASAGVLEMPRAAGGVGRFVARYLPPPDRFPQVALLVVELAAGSRRVHARAQVALDGSTVVPFHTSPSAAVTMRVGDQTFGPIVADRQGHVDIPIVVPPGIRTGTARAVDHNAAARETVVDLQLPPFPRIVVLAPPGLEVAGFAEITVLAVEPSGAPTPASELILASSDGIVHPIGGNTAGEARFLFEAPHRLGGGAVALTATAPGTPPARADIAVALSPGAPFRLLVATSRRQLLVGGGGTADIVVSARDAFGNATPTTGLAARVDGQPQPVAVGADGVGRLSVTAPARYPGRDRIAIEVSLGAARATEGIRLIGGPPVRLTLEVQHARMVADGQLGTELRALAVDANGTPTAVPGLSWDTPDGRVREVRVPRDGEYVADYVPDRTREPQRQQVSVMASRELRATGSIEVTPPPVRLVAGMRAGLYTNLGPGSGPAAFLEALRPFEVRGRRFSAGLTVGYLHGDVSATGFQAAPSMRVQIDQLPVMLLARVRRAVSEQLELAADVAAGISWADVRLRAPATRSIEARAIAPAFAAGGDVSFPLKPGRLVIGVRYLWIELGRTSEGDQIDGNSAGFIGDIGYKMPF